MHRTPRTARTIALAAAGLLALTACAPALTINAYAPSDGTRVDLTNELRGLNLLILAAEQGGEGLVQGALANRTGGTVTFTLTVDGAAPVEVEVDPATTVYLGTADGEQVLLDTVAKAPGTFLEATLDADGESASFQLPVLDGTLPEYAGSVPQG
ncbi:hypothetical protein Xcel_2960 [Xylanimonas cellulosilytica DSM 15894]|uniref:Lipoprotein n=1 Tax=Xylanimonas cellulosilytica (strain DSM 15894 / JCM 12276 / CECT 5975 / KCTC 9989 / LMG 20990 / NBRC 107835 / XIL07) TaxID=446471 RepID=D1BZ69_XYLCX|nr:hypothetical protein [Xylanimonas cellulosilytica]ACZ31966.1 hypothetical protein Xcel_2960 [Xylanimonas cellulosilytica DSM 15894]